MEKAEEEANSGMKGANKKAGGYGKARCISSIPRRPAAGACAVHMARHRSHKPRSPEDRPLQCCWTISAVVGANSRSNAETIRLVQIHVFSPGTVALHSWRPTGLDGSRCQGEPQEAN